MHPDFEIKFIQTSKPHLSKNRILRENGLSITKYEHSLKQYLAKNNCQGLINRLSFLPVRYSMS